MITWASCRTSVPNISEERRLPQPRMVQRRREGSGWRGRGRHATPGGSVGHLAGSRSSATSLSTVSTSYWGCVTAYSTWENMSMRITTHKLSCGWRLSFRSFSFGLYLRTTTVILTKTTVETLQENLYFF